MEKIEFLPKIINPANAPKLRPIEDFWGFLKTNAYENNWSAKNVSQLKNKIQLCLKKMDSNLVQKIAGRSKKDWTLSVEMAMMPYNLIFL